MKQDQQDIEYRNHRGQTSLNERFQAVKHALETTDDRDQGKRGLHAHAVIPLAFGTEFAVLGHAALLTEAVVSQHDTASIELLDERVELVVWRVHGIPIPVDHLAETIEYPAQLDADAERPLSLDFLPNCCGLRPSRMGNSNSIG